MLTRTTGTYKPTRNNSKKQIQQSQRNQKNISKYKSREITRNHAKSRVVTRDLGIMDIQGHGATKITRNHAHVLCTIYIEHDCCTKIFKVAVNHRKLLPFLR
jgi:hypothetical protein